MSNHHTKEKTMNRYEVKRFETYNSKRIEWALCFDGEPVEIYPTKRQSVIAAQSANQYLATK